MSSAARLLHPVFQRLPLWIGALVLLAMLQFQQLGLQGGLVGQIEAQPAQRLIATPVLALNKPATPETPVRLMPVLHETKDALALPSRGFSLLRANRLRHLSAALPVQGWQARAPPVAAAALI